MQPQEQKEGKLITSFYSVKQTLNNHIKDSIKLCDQWDLKFMNMVSVFNKFQGLNV